jgi:hypothetical protein
MVFKPTFKIGDYKQNVNFVYLEYYNSFYNKFSYFLILRYLLNLKNKHT